METSLDIVAANLRITPAPDAYDKIVAAVSYLIAHDMDKLISILYRMDVSEKKLRLSLENNAGSDAARLVTELMIERQDQKIKSRQQFSSRDDKNISDEERW